MRRRKRTHKRIARLLAISFCAIATGIAWTAIIGLFLILKPELPI